VIDPRVDEMLDITIRRGSSRDDERGDRRGPIARGEIQRREKNVWSSSGPPSATEVTNSLSGVRRPDGQQRSADGLRHTTGNGGWTHPAAHGGRLEVPGPEHRKEVAVHRIHRTL
jgi:hypothetical protein